MCIMLMSTWFICASLLIDCTTYNRCSRKQNMHLEDFYAAKSLSKCQVQRSVVEGWNVEQTHYEALCSAWINTFWLVKKTRCPFSSLPTLTACSEQTTKNVFIGLQKVEGVAFFQSVSIHKLSLKAACSWILIPVLVHRVLTRIGLGCRPENFLWQIPARYGWQGLLGKGATDTWNRRGGTSAPCMCLLSTKGNDVRLLKIIISSADAGKVFMCSFKVKEAILDDMFTSAMMQTPFGKHLKEMYEFYAFPDSLISQHWHW